MNRGRVLLTGATGFIGSHTWLALLDAGYEVVGLDDFSNSSPQVVERIAQLFGRPPEFVQADVGDSAALEAVFAAGRFDAAVHFAAFKAVGDSMCRPLDYYANNLGGLLNLGRTMSRHGSRTLVFSSSATVYGRPESLPVAEDAPLSATNPYGATKLIGENILRDLERADPTWAIALLRYFNPVGAHPSGAIGEDPRGVPNNLVPYVAQVAVGRRDRLRVFGRDYDTPDGTGVRDYIHVTDLAEGHVAALDHLLRERRSVTANLGTGRGYSVLEVVRAFERASGREIPVEFAERRPGDVDACWADVSRAQATLGWRATRDLDAMCADAWRWQRLNPDGLAADTPSTIPENR